jgi:hypothetical protein
VHINDYGVVDAPKNREVSAMFIDDRTRAAVLLVFAVASAVKSVRAALRHARRLGWI